MGLPPLTSSPTLSRLSLGRVRQEEKHAHSRSSAWSGERGYSSDGELSVRSGQEKDAGWRVDESGEMDEMGRDGSTGLEGCGIESAERYGGTTEDDCWCSGLLCRLEHWVLEGGADDGGQLYGVGGR